MFFTPSLNGYTGKLIRDALTLLVYHSRRCFLIALPTWCFAYAAGSMTAS